MSDDPIRILLIGKTGEGKSTLTNFMLAKECAKTSDSLTSCTKDPQRHCGRWLGTGAPVEIIDTPGLLDSDEGNFETCMRLKKAAEDMKDGINAVLLVHGLHNIRMDGAVKTMLQVLNKLFPEPEFWERSAIVLTQWDKLKADKQEPSFLKWRDELPAELEDCGSRLKSSNMHVYKGAEDPHCLDQLFPWVQQQKKIVPEMVAEIQDGDDSKLMKIVAEMQQQLMEMELKAEKERAALMGEMHTQQQQFLEKQIEMQKEFSASLAEQNRQHARDLDRMMEEQRKLQKELADAKQQPVVFPRRKKGCTIM